MRITLPPRLVVPVALTAAVAAAASTFLGDTAINPAPMARPGVASAAQTGAASPMTAQPDWRRIETAAGRSNDRVQLAQAEAPQPATVPLGRRVVTTLPTADGQVLPVPNGRATSFTLNSRPTQPSPERPPVGLSLTQPALEPIAQPMAPPIPEPIAAAAPVAPAEPIAAAPAAVEPKIAATPAPEAAARQAAKPARTTLAQVAERTAWRVQIASLPSQDAAEGIWTKAQTGNTDLLGALTLNVEKAEINGRGTFYRVQTQPFADRKAADDLCNSLKARNMSCLVVRTAG